MSTSACFCLVLLVLLVLSACFCLVLLGSAWLCLAPGSARFCLLGSACSAWFCLTLLDFAWFFLVLLGSEKPIESLSFPGGLRISLC